MSKPSKLFNQCVGPFEVRRPVNQVLVEVALVLFMGRALVAHITRLRLYTTPRGQGLGNILETLDELAEVANKEAEEIGERG